MESVKNNMHIFTESAAKFEKLENIQDFSDSMTVASEAGQSNQTVSVEFASEAGQSGVEQVEEFALELPTIDAVAKGLWKSMSRKSKTVIVEEESAEVESTEKCIESEQIEESQPEEVEEAEESEEESEDEKTPEEYLEEMKNLINNQHHSKASRYCKIIRESLEFSKEELQGEQKDYESLKHEVLGILQRRIDQKTYKDQIKQCKKTAEVAESDMPLGTGLLALKKTYKRIIRSKNNWKRLN